MQRRSSRILIASHHSCTIGDDAQLKCMIESLKNVIPHARMTVLSDYPHVTRKIFRKKGIRVLPWVIDRKEFVELSQNSQRKLYSMFCQIVHCVMLKSLGYSLEGCKKMPSKVVNEFEKADIILFSPGGPYFGDLYADLLPIHVLHALLAKAFEKPLMLFGTSVGPFQRSDTLSLCKKALGVFDLIAAREPESRKTLKVLNLENEKILTADLAVLHRPSKRDSATKILASLGLDSKDTPIFAITVQPYIPYFTDSQYSHYKNTIADIANHIISEYNARILFIPFAYHEAHDIPLIQEICALITDASRVKVLPEGYDSATIQSVLREVDFLVATRLHSMILAATMGTPGILIGYEHKASGFMRMMDERELLVDMKELTSDRLRSMIRRFWPERGKLSLELRCKTQQLRRRALLNAKLASKLLSSPSAKTSRIDDRLELASALIEHLIGANFSELESRMKGLNAQANALRAEVDEKAQWALRLIEELKQRDATIRQLQNDFEERTQWASRLDKELKERDETLLQLQKDFEERTKWATKLQEELKQRDARIQDLNSSVSERNGWIESLKREIDVKDGHLERTRKTIDEQKSKIGSLQIELERVNKEIEQKDRRILELEGEVQRLANWGNDLDKVVAERDQTIRQLQNDFEERTQWASRLDKELKERDETLLQLQKDFEERTKWATKLQEELKQRDATILQIQKDLEEGTQWALRLDKELKERDTAILQLQKELEEVTRWALRLENELQEKNKQILGLQKEQE